MPRAKRKRFSNPRRRRSDPKQAAEEEEEAAANAGQAPPSPPTSSTTSHDDHDDDDALPPFYNTTFSTHRVSPLYLGPQPLSRGRLEVLARRLRDTLVGDIVRGIEVGLDGGNDTSMTRAGALELVEMRWVRLDSLLGLAIEHNEGEDDGDSSDNHTRRPGSRDLSIDAPPNFGRRVWRRQRALCISLQYENALCTAVLMPTLSRPDEESADEDADAPQPSSLFNMPSAVDNNASGGNSSRHFVHLPLLLLRMPPPLKPVIVDFLSATFDCRIQPLRLGTRSLAQTWERWVRDAGVPVRGPSAKDALLTLGFYAPSVVSDKASAPQKKEKQTEGDSSEDDEAAVVLGLRAIDVIIPAEDVKRFVEAGKSSPQGARHKDEDPRKRRKLGGQTDEEGWWWRHAAPAATEEADDEHAPQQPFLEALARYVDHHLALDIFHPAVRITRIACGSFVLSEGRVKIFAPAGHAEGELALSGAERQGVQGFVAGLINRAKGRPLGKG